MGDLIQSYIPRHTVSVVFLTSDKHVPPSTQTLKRFKNRPPQQSGKHTHTCPPPV